MKKITFLLPLIMSIVCSCSTNDNSSDFSFNGYKSFINYDSVELNLYEDSDDGVVKYHTFDAFSRCAYDDATDSLILQKNNNLYIHNYESGKLIHTFDMGRKDVSSIDTYNGKLAVSFASDIGEIQLYDLRLKECETYTSSYATAQVFISYNFLVVSAANLDGIYKIDLSSKETTVYWQAKETYACVVDFNRKEQLLYIAERKISNKDLSFLNVEDGTVDLFPSISVGEEGPYFDGQNVHVDKKIIHPYSGRVLKGGDVYEDISNENFTYTYTLYSNNLLSFIKGEEYNTFIYSKELNDLVYGIKVSSKQIFEESKTKYLIHCGDNRHIAVIDLTKIKR